MTSAISIEHLCMEFGEPGQTLRALDGSVKLIRKRQEPEQVWANEVI